MLAETIRCARPQDTCIYFGALEAAADSKPMHAMLDNFDRALTHPDETDLRRLTVAIEKYGKK